MKKLWEIASYPHCEDVKDLLGIIKKMKEAVERHKSDRYPMQRSPSGIDRTLYDEVEKILSV